MNATVWSSPVAAATPPGAFAGSSALAAATMGLLGAGGAASVFGYRVTGAASDTTYATSWTNSESAPANAVAMLCTADASPICADGSNLQVAVDAQSISYALGQKGSELLFASTDAMGVWQHAQVVATGINTPFFLAVDPTGNVAIIYRRNDTSNPAVTVTRLYGKRMRAGQSFGPELLLSGANVVSGSSTDSAALVIDSMGTATATFLEDANPPPSAFAPAVTVVRWPLMGARQTNTLSSASQGSITTVKLTVDAHDLVTAAWAGAAGVAASTIYVSQFLSSSWTAAQAVSPPMSPDNFTSPVLAADDAGTVTLAYKHFAGQPATVTLLAQRKPVGQPWAAATVISSSATNAANVAGTGNVGLASRNPGQADVIFVQTVNSVDRLYAARFRDTTPPTIMIVTPADGATYTVGAAIPASYSCQDEAGGSGLASCTGTVANGSNIDTATTGSKSFTVNASDNAGNTATKTVTYSVIAIPPSVTITTPQNGATYLQNQSVNADYSCSPGSASLLTCTGPVRNGQPFDTATPGSKTFTVTARDSDGLTTSMSVQYTVQAPANNGGGGNTGGNAGGGGGALDLNVLLLMLALTNLRMRRHYCALRVR